MGVFLLELKRGDRVAAEKVDLASYVQFVWLWHVIYVLWIIFGSILTKFRIFICNRFFENGEITCRVPNLQLCEMSSRWQDNICIAQNNICIVQNYICKVKNNICIVQNNISIVQNNICIVENLIQR